MAEAQLYVFTHRELAEALVKQQGLHEGHWGIYVEFGIAGANIAQGEPDGPILPAAIVPILKVGIQRLPRPNSLSVDAAVVNPGQKQLTGSKKTVASSRKARAHSKE